MKRVIFLFLLNFLAINGFSQSKYPVKWEVSSERIDELTYKVLFTAEIDATYHIYPQKGATGGMGMPTKFIFEENPNLEFKGALEEKGEEQQGNKPLPYYSKGVTFTQIVKLTADKEARLNATIRFMACTNQMCLLPSTKKFTVNLNSKSIPK
ncbi:MULTISPECIES: hypothetical protein [unclassified Leeuwenhoekiella]|uniref:hypothetical protein n=1 Tax=unclassified Leeuwenhoekiella TaxID=2615029 RepID=UPI000C469EB2|nr:MULTISPECIES: hypothetical protein [unclassified Leeuwenhoekiella]MAW95397.1 hypothetical protein [Leeuwenhoekiella sp.]MBA80784.1 hypothetical protein [Leeuwenhoekiella sp.]|tara:strand:- start:14992 stop:15450 length:459 start_codon:yes stop_codon:yes gene_type:complete